MTTPPKGKRLPKALALAAGWLVLIVVLFRLLSSPPGHGEGLGPGGALPSSSGAVAPTDLAPLEQPALDPLGQGASRVKAKAAPEQPTGPGEAGRETPLAAALVTAFVTGRVEIEGGPTSAPTGSMRGLYLSDVGDPTPTAFVIEVIDGQFRFEVPGPIVKARTTPRVNPLADELSTFNPRNPHVRFHRARLNGDRYVFTGASSTKYASSKSKGYAIDGAEIILHLKRIPITVLTVVDASSGAPLSGVTVRVSNPLRGRYSNLPPTFDEANARENKASILVQDAASPIELAEPPPGPHQDVLTCWVSCEGYGWEKISIDAWGGGERRVSLQQAGSLKVEVTDEWPKDIVVEVTRVGDKEVLFLMIESRGRRRVIGDLSPGVYQATARRRRPRGWVPGYEEPSVPTVHGTAKGTVKAGERSTLRLTILPDTEEPGVPVSGVIVVPPEWGLDPTGRRPVASFSAIPAGASESRGFRQELPLGEKMLGHERDSYAFRLGKVPAGQYVFELKPGLHSETFEVPENHVGAGVENLRFKVPPPCVIFIRPVDGETGNPVQATELRWRTNRNEETSHWTHRSPRKKTGDGGYILRVAEGPVTIRCDSAHYQSALEDVVAAEGAEFILKLRGRVNGRIELKHQGTGVPWPTATKLNLKSVDGAGKVNWESSSTSRPGASPSFSVTQPGWYLVDVPEVDGFRSQVPVKIELRGGALNTITIELVAD